MHDVIEDFRFALEKVREGPFASEGTKLAPRFRRRPSVTFYAGLVQIFPRHPPFDEGVKWSFVFNPPHIAHTMGFADVDAEKANR